MTIAIMAFTALAAAFVIRQAADARRTDALAYEPSHARGVAHIGATADWSPAVEVAVEAPPATVAHAEADVEELTILADFDDLIDRWRADPDYLTEWRTSVDDVHTAYGLDTEALHRWRWGVVDVPTGEYQLVIPEGTS